MKLLREYIRGLLIEQEEQSDLEKLQDIFTSNGAQAAELGEMILPDSPEVKAMREIIDLTRSFLELFEDPALTYQERQKQRNPWNQEVRDLIHIVFPQNPKRMRLINMMFSLGQFYIQLEGIIMFGKLGEWMPKIETVSEWAGAPVPEISKSGPK